MELFEFKGEDLTEEEDGGIIRRIRTRGEGYAKPNEGAIVEGEAHNLGFSVFSSTSLLFWKHWQETRGWKKSEVTVFSPCFLLAGFCTHEATSRTSS